MPGTVNPAKNPWLQRLSVSGDLLLGSGIDMAPNCLLNICVYSQRQIMFIVLIRETFPGFLAVNNLADAESCLFKVLRVRTDWALSLKRTFMPPPLKLRKHRRMDETEDRRRAVQFYREKKSRCLLLFESSNHHVYEDYPESWSYCRYLSRTGVLGMHCYIPLKIRVPDMPSESNREKQQLHHRLPPLATLLSWFSALGSFPARPKEWASSSPGT